MGNHVVVHLVHGTWPYGIWRHIRRLNSTGDGEPAWFESGSDFRKSVKDNSNTKIRFVKYKWSGDNSFEERAEAALGLRSHLKEWFKKENEAKHVVVAHSHGGTVAITAVADSEFQVVSESTIASSRSEARLTGIVTMATPFVVLRQYTKKNQTPLSSDMFKGYVSNATLRLLLVSVAIGYLLSSIIWFAFIFSVLVTFDFIINFRARRRRFESLFAMQPIRPNYTFDLVALRAPRDEASLGIGGTVLLDYVISKIWSLIIPIVGVVNVVVLIGAIFSKEYSSQLGATSLFLGMGSVIGITISFLVTNGLLALATGKEIFSLGAFGHVQSESLPPNTSARLEMLPLPKDEQKGLRHSLHEIAATRAKVAFWIDSLARDDTHLLSFTSSGDHQKIV